MQITTHNQKFKLGPQVTWVLIMLQLRSRQDLMLKVHLVSFDWDNSHIQNVLAIDGTHKKHTDRICVCMLVSLSH